MKKYRFLTEGEALELGDEQKFINEFGEEFEEWVSYHPSTIGEIEIVTKRGEYLNRYRRLVPFSGKTAFLLNYSPLLRVIVDTDGLSDEQIDEAIVKAAKEQFFSNRNVREEFEENIDWRNTMEDVDAPYCEDDGPDIGASGDEYRFLELGDVIQEGDEYRMFLDSEYRPVRNSIGEQVVESWIGSVRRKIVKEPQYRPFEDGDIMELGDQCTKGIGGNIWKAISFHSIGEVVDHSIVGNPYYRKLIKNP